MLCKKMCGNSFVLKALGCVFFFLIVLLSLYQIAESPLAQIEEYKRQCSEIDYDALYAEPDKYKGTEWKACGRVFHVYETEGHTQEFLFELYNAKILYIEYALPENADRISEGDHLQVYGTFYDLKFYPAPLGEFVFVPKLDCRYIEFW